MGLFRNVMMRIKTILLGADKGSMTMDGTQYMEVTDSDDFSFGDASTDSPFSLTVRVWLDDTNSSGFISKRDASGDMEYWFGIRSGNISITLYDQNATTFINGLVSGGSYLKSYDWNEITVTYDGSSLDTGFNFIINGADTTTYSNSTGGTYTAMHNTTDPLWIGKTQLGDDLDGAITRAVVWNKELSVAEARESVVLQDLSQHSAYANVVGWWEFDPDDISGSSVTDRSGNGHTGTLINSPVGIEGVRHPYDYQLLSRGQYSNLPPAYNGNNEAYGGFAFDLGGTNERIEIDGNALSHTAGAVFAWVKTTASGAQQFVTASRDPDRIYLRQRNISNTFSVYIGGSSEIDTGIVINDGKWHHIGLAWDGTNYYIFHNGVQVATNTYTGLTGVATFSCIGAYLTGIGSTANTHATAKIADVLFLDTETTEAEATAIYNSHAPLDELQEALSGNIVGYWRGYSSYNGSDGVIDESPNSNHGTMTNMENSDIVFEYPRRITYTGSFDFDGVNEFVEISDNASHSFGNSTTDSPFSISFWAKPDSYSGYFVMKGDSASNIEYSVDNVGGSLRFRLFDGNTSNDIEKRTPMSNGVWSHVVCTYDGSGTSAGMRVYVNGRLGAQTAGDTGGYTAMDNTNSSLYLGRYTSVYYDGKMSHVAFFDKELTNIEVNEIYNDGSPTNLLDTTVAGNLISWWKIDDTDDPTGTVIDQIGTQDGTANNMASGNLVEDEPKN